ncbi:aminoacyltransferase [Streptococcus sp. DD12]|uniref:aminoacyltransferase n=1 Tax=Streptococcus sp. DD12 TaxID=1777880 RepID=UPI00079591CF|nr:aminoacyltransferase [Streptococcus sp. DD12]KXT75888.1 tRNA-dependent lipid II-Ala--L-alanine ligase [Streptococcus sp. DD12]
MQLEILSLADYQRFLKKARQASFTQTPEMAELLKKRGFTVDFVGLRVDGVLQVAGVLYSKPMTGGLHMEMNSGPVSLNRTYLGDFAQALAQYAKANGALELLLKPYDTYQTFDDMGQATGPAHEELILAYTSAGYQFDGLQTGYPGGEPDWHYVKDLTGLTKANLRQSFSKKGKPLVKKAASFGTQLRPLKRDELAIFKAVTEATSERRDYVDKPLDYYEAFYDSFGDKAEFMVATLNFQAYAQHLEEDQAKLQDKLAKLEERFVGQESSPKFQNQARELKAQLATFAKRIVEAQELIERYGTKDQVLAVSLFIYTDQEAVYLFSGSYPEFNRFYAPALLQEHVMTQAIQRGISFYSFLGIMGVFDGSDGVFRFKQNFKGSIVRKMGTFRYYPNPLKYKLIQGLKKLLGR